MDRPYWQTAGYGVEFPFEDYERVADFMRRPFFSRQKPQAQTFSRKIMGLCFHSVAVKGRGSGWAEQRSFPAVFDLDRCLLYVKSIVTLSAAIATRRQFVLATQALKRCSSSSPWLTQNSLSIGIACPRFVGAVFRRAAKAGSSNAAVCWLVEP